MKSTKLTTIFLCTAFLLSACGNNTNVTVKTTADNQISAPANSAADNQTSAPVDSTTNNQASAPVDSTTDNQTFAPVDQTADLESVPEMPDANPNSTADASSPASKAAIEEFCPVEIIAQSAVLYDCSSNTVLASKNAANSVYPASTAKLMAALIAVDTVPLDTVVTIGDELNLVQPHSSLAYLSVGQQLTMNDLLHAMLIPSGNDAAFAIAAFTGRTLAGNFDLSAAEAVQVFVDKMNENAKLLSLKNTVYTNPDGFDDPNQQTTAEDLAKLSAEAAAHPEITAITRLYQYNATFVSGEIITWTNTNDMLNPDSPYYIPDCIGLKTGSSEYSGYCITGAYEYNNTNYIIVILNGGKDSRWEDSRRLYDYLTSTVSNES